MKRKPLLLAVVFSLTAICAILHAEETEIRVQLSTESKQVPLYLGSFQCHDKSIDNLYMLELEMILEKDLGHSAKTKLVKRDPAKEKILFSDSNATAFSSTKWKEWNLPYVIKAEIKNKKLEIKAFTTSTASLKTFPEITLTGTLSSDRRQIHKIADSLLKALFNIEGICSTKLLYSYHIHSAETSDSKWKSEIWECDWDGHNARQVTKDGSYSVSPAIVPSLGRSGADNFFYVSYKIGQPKIYFASTKDGIGKKAVELRGNQLLPSVSPQRDKIAYICDASGRSDLFIQLINPEDNSLGKPLQLYSYPRSSQGSPTFSPDGKKIAFVSDKDGAPRIYIIPAVFSEKRQEPVLLTKQNRENSCPAWSPDGSKIAYSSKVDGTRQIWIYDFNAKEERQLTTGSGNKENPAWAPNSMHIVFNSTDGSSSDLYVVNIHQPEAIKITKGPGKKHYPAWSARKD